MHTNERTPKMDESTTLPPPFWEGRPALERAILSCLMDGAEWTVADLVEECGRDDVYVGRALRNLEAWTMVERRLGGGQRQPGVRRRRPDAWRMAPAGWPQ